MGDIHAYNCKVYEKNLTANECTCGVLKMSVLENEYVGTRWASHDRQTTYRVVKLMGSGKFGLCNEATWVLDPYNFTDEQMQVYIIRNQLKRA